MELGTEGNALIEAKTVGCPAFTAGAYDKARPNNVTTAARLMRE
jgi:hypothetical protein